MIHRLRHKPRRQLTHQRVAGQLQPRPGIKVAGVGVLSFHAHRVRHIKLPLLDHVKDHFSAQTDCTGNLVTLGHQPAAHLADHRSRRGGAGVLITGVEQRVGLAKIGQVHLARRIHPCPPVHGAAIARTHPQANADPHALGNQRVGRAVTTVLFAEASANVRRQPIGRFLDHAGKADVFSLPANPPPLLARARLGDSRGDLQVHQHRARVQESLFLLFAQRRLIEGLEAVERRIERLHRPLNRRIIAKFGQFAVGRGADENKAVIQKRINLDQCFLAQLRHGPDANTRDDQARIGLSQRNRRGPDQFPCFRARRLGGKLLEQPRTPASLGQFLAHQLAGLIENELAQLKSPVLVRIGHHRKHLRILQIVQIHQISRRQLHRKPGLDAAEKLPLSRRRQIRRDSPRRRLSLSDSPVIENNDAGNGTAQAQQKACQSHGGGVVSCTSRSRPKVAWA